MFVIDLIERKVGDIEAKVIPLDNLSTEDLDWIKALAGGMTEEIYNQTYHLDRMRNCDAHLINIDVVRVFLVKQCVLLWTILQGNVKRYPQMDQLVAWLNETKHTHKGELMLREREVHEPMDLAVEGPTVLFGSSLEYALQTAPHMIESTLDKDEIAVNNMSDEDLKSLFDESCMDLSADPEPEEPVYKEILLTQVVVPKFEVDFEVEDGDPTNLTDEDEIEMALEALTDTVGPKDLVVIEEAS
jgi:hypothetical protein